MGGIRDRTILGNQVLPQSAWHGGDLRAGTGGVACLGNHLSDLGDADLMLRSGG